MAIKVGIVGLGYSARTFHLPFLKSLEPYRVTAVMSRQAELAQTLLPGARHRRSMSELLDDQVDLVVITAPNTEHFALARTALVARKHVVLEKPFVNTADEGRELIALARRENLVLSVYHNRRWDGDFLTVTRLLQQGVLGQVFHYESHFDRFRPEPRPRWREAPLPGSGILYDLGSHLIDQALILFGAPRSVAAQVLSQRRGAEVDDYMHLVLDYAPLQVILHASMLTARPGTRFSIHGDRYSFIKEGLDPQEDRLKAGLEPVGSKWAEESPESFGTLHDPEGGDERVPTDAGAYQRYYQSLADCIVNGAPNPVPPEQALKVIQLIELALLSQKTGQRISLTDLRL